ncbi:tetraacyldisaccharide 4'-kinase [Flavobacterium johnsoniae]|jgi:tetraacyldisaccharide 4'-kinase|uniref:Tetraacyldisaccharide 4'-kinase n=1 Tax=Flavobacterium johnsoniae (strain ATCC 17061 / DSM 2064 / JCM 8514 / BCRC 14874 / CCUG 350202 / NBRC 14942 / NCIMB 11054 / UW101) TaxID=376686 RepID=LPXK_FLAJ1|nr:tetraacyldisaccharide 4'-kinase [Flavobacterium johnsoniae]A5FNE6.1 RecName: Full=Tetraacyldisaccharide 4'-kinase; AltName: Full=Lipid A 4'-kinase [Flavobacterium johnsoniae UW101]ABQ03267.1 tetraacyldisaccharide 4'-kinase [Flavobacterium johnsoniae UW101]OXG01310.1 tetraacyldisaccharide 4'-kinase [Flavobacterium johnsoniae UW101]WQG79868.1 tetraacyldisaccharide 4'-kinase [Flavobacterium johnsoniae UW101]SHL80349.1 lipid-A-disaccharide kinase [Flavobacterium johnsoniae]
MNLLRKILFPFAILYGLITSIRNFLFDKGILKSTSFDLPVIAVGNLSVGGTGKTPQIEYLIRLLSNKYRAATLSRGYKRKSEGFVLADENSNAEILGDEPFQFYQKFPDVQVAVDANRTNGITQLLSQNVKPQVILLDDAYQHRKVKAGFYILLTSYDDLYADDFMLPTGNLRESRSGANRANIVVVTKCPKNLSEEKQAEIRLKLKLSCSQQIFFTYIDYDVEIYGKDEKISAAEIKSESKLLLAGIAKPKPFFEYLKNENDECLTFPDHHHFSDADLESIQNKANGRKIITTEKDYVRLKDSKLVSQLYYLPIKSTFINHQQNFDVSILQYIKENLEP